MLVIAQLDILSVQVLFMANDECVACLVAIRRLQQHSTHTCDCLVIAPTRCMTDTATTLCSLH